MTIYRLTLLALATQLFLEDTSAQSRLYTIHGEQYSEHLGLAVSFVDDLTGDGRPDVLLGAPYHDGPSGNDQGRVRVHRGSNGNHRYDLDWPRDQAWFGYSVSGLGDLDGDGKGEFVVGAPLDNLMGSQAGAVAIYSGSSGSLLDTKHGSNPDDLLGWSVCGVGEVSGDGLEDWAAGAPRYDGLGGDSGRVDVWSGSDGALLYSIDGLAPGGNLGRCIDVLGDLDRDDRSDFVVGAQREYASGQFDGYALLISGRDGSIIRILRGPSGGTGGFASSVAGIGDANGDGGLDVAIGSPWDDSSGGQSGRVDVYSAKDGALLWSAIGDEDIELGGCLSRAGDVDGDGLADVVAGARDWGVDGQGSAWVLSGVDGSIIMKIEGWRNDEYLGSAVAGGRDLDGDGAPELLLGVPFDSSGQVGEGAARVYSSSCLGPKTYCSAKLSSFGCLPAITSTGVPSRQVTDDFHVQATSVISGTMGIFMWSRSRQSTPWMGGRLCLEPSVARTPPQVSSGNTAPDQDCGGVLDYHISHEFMENEGMSAGTTIFGQFWYRDPMHNDGTGAGLSNGIEVTFCP